MKHQENIFSEYRKLKDKGFSFDGVWIGEDIAYDNGLYFSPKKYRDQLKPIHKDICSFFAEKGQRVFFHCDGKIEGLIPHLVGMGVKAIHPVQERCNPNFLAIKKDLAGIITIIGGVGLERLYGNIKDLEKYIYLLMEGGNYIFSFDGPLPDDFDKKEYQHVLKNIEGFATYR